MVITDLARIHRQLALTPGLRTAVEFLRSKNTRDLPDGRIDLYGNEVFALVQRYETAATKAPKFEYHQKYLDVQFIASGEEIIGWAPAERMTVTESYDGAKDAGFGTVPEGQWTPAYLREGQLAVLFPEDGHAPRIAAGAPCRVVKVVVKVAV